MKKLVVGICLTGMLGIQSISAQTDTAVYQTPVVAEKTVEVKKEEAPKKWHEQVQVRGYVQVRYNGLLQNNENLKCDQCDRSWGGKNTFFIRRTRIIFSGQVSKNAYFYIQPDFASSPSTGVLNYAQLRDAYFDIGVDPDNEFRFRIGQSKVPYGFENLQSSQNRLPLDRADATNSALSNERDLGVFFYWAPKSVRKFYSDAIKENIKGSGDYGCFAFGMYNGQTPNQQEGNKNFHYVGRFTYPIKIKNQIIEPGIQAYSGDYVLNSVTVNATDPKKSVKTNSSKSYQDARAAATFILYPKPFGIQAEYNLGKGPEFDKVTDSISVQNLTGGYVTASYKAEIKGQTLIPFLRYHYYDGGKKHELDARSYHVREIEIGAEWQPYKAFELVAMYVYSERRFEDMAKQNNFQTGRLIRMQAQFNF